MAQNVVRVRTFKDDMDRVRTGASAPPEPANPVPPLPKPAPKNVVPREAPLPQPAIAEKPAPQPHKTLQETLAPKSEKPVEKSPAKKAAPLPIDTRAVAPSRRSILAHEESLEPFTANDIENDGTIVTDTKRKRFRLFPAIAEAFKSWLFEKKEEFEEHAKPKHTVSPATTRTDVIKEAAARSAIAPRDDHRIVRERLRHVPRTAPTGDVAIKKASEVPKPAWTHTTEEPAPPPVVQRELPPAPEPIVEAPPVVQREPEPAPPPAPRVPEPPPEPARTPVHATPPPEPEKPAPPVQPRTRASTLPQSRRAYLGFAVVCIVAAAAGIGLAVWFFAYTNDRNTTPVVPETGNVFIESSAAAAVPLGRTHAAFMTALRDAHAANGSLSLVEFYPTVATAPSEEAPATTADVLAVFKPNAPGSFVRSITAIGFGSYRGAPFMILKTASFDTALGGMLAWEASITRDLSPFFGSEVVAAPAFTDIVHANRDLRVLFNAAGNDRLVYSFLNRNTILVTTERAVVEDLAPLIP